MKGKVKQNSRPIMKSTTSLTLDKVKKKKGFESLNGGAMRDRTADLLHAMQALSQLSYSPTKRVASVDRVS